MECDHCTFLNPPNTQICTMCCKSLKTFLSNVNEESIGILCDTCTLLNSLANEICEVCGTYLYNNNGSSDEDDVDEEQVQNEESSACDDEPGSTVYKALAEAPHKECEICYGEIGSDYFAMFECIHIFCSACAVTYFTNQITERPILDCICPLCNLPDLRSNADKHDQYFSLLLPCLKPILDENIMNLLDKKLTEVALVSDPNFVWCIQCTSGFVNNMQRKMVQCSECRVRFCFECKKVWQSQHTNISCEQFANWQRDNNFDVSHEAIGSYLRKNGIECPKCKFKYGLSRGGCIHFTCSQCKYEFCFGCTKPFVRSCTISTYCKSVGLHAHHPRNCFYYLRDKAIADLQGLLKANKIDFMIEMPESLQKNETAGQSCPIELQIESGHRIVDTICNEPTDGGQAGLCKKHYKEYLILTITKAKLEPNSLLTLQNYHEMLRFQGIAIPLKAINQNDGEYKDVCEKLVKNNIPLQ